MGGHARPRHSDQTDRQPSALTWQVIAHDSDCHAATAATGRLLESVVSIQVDKALRTYDLIMALFAGFAQACDATY
jgi:hypothetical protein